MGDGIVRLDSVCAAGVFAAVDQFREIISVAEVWIDVPIRRTGV